VAFSAAIAKSTEEVAVERWGQVEESNSGLIQGSKHREHRSTEDSPTRSSGGGSSSEAWWKEGAWDVGSTVRWTRCSCGGDAESVVSAATTGADGRGGLCRGRADGMFAEVCGAANRTL
jgi:hypothetical protein